MQSAFEIEAVDGDAAERAAPPERKREGEAIRLRLGQVETLDEDVTVRRAARHRLLVLILIEEQMVVT